MADYIVLTAQEADAVRGPTTSGAALDPVLRQGDVSILGVEVLDDPAHAEHREYLAALPVLADDDPAFPPAIPIYLPGMDAPEKAAAAVKRKPGKQP